MHENNSFYDIRDPAIFGSSKMLAPVVKQKFIFLMKTTKFLMHEI